MIYGTCQSKSREAFRAEHFFKQTDGKWLYQGYGATDDVLKIETIDCQLSLREIYDRVELTLETEESGED